MEGWGGDVIVMVVNARVRVYVIVCGFVCVCVCVWRVGAGGVIFFSQWGVGGLHLIAELGRVSPSASVQNLSIHATVFLGSDTILFGIRRNMLPNTHIHKPRLDCAKVKTYLKHCQVQLHNTYNIIKDGRTIKETNNKRT